MKKFRFSDLSGPFSRSHLAVSLCLFFLISSIARPQLLALPASADTVAAFDGWLAKYLQDSSATSLEQGIRLAHQRRAALRQLIQSSPSQALAAALPEATRRRLPEALQAELETPVSGIGDLEVLDSLSARNTPTPDRERRIVRIDGQTYRAFVFGRRALEATKFAIPLHGIAIDGWLALDEDVLRKVGTDEVAASHRPILDLRSATEKALPVQEAAYAEMAGRVYRFASVAHRRKAELRLQKAEAQPGPKLARPVEETLQDAAPAASTDAATTAWTVGNKKVLVIRVDFSDLPGSPRGFGTTYSSSTCQKIMDEEVGPYYLHSSYGLSSLTSKVTTQLYRMPKTAHYYATQGADDELHAAAEDAASDDYNLDGYDRIIVLFSYLGDLSGSTIDYGGLGDIGGPNVWVNGDFEFRLVAHELGHTYGLYHANVWQVSDGNPISDQGEDVEYADDYDTMSSNFADDHGVDFNPWFKNTLGWIADDQVRTITASGTYRVWRFDNAASNGATLGLKIERSSTENLWIGLRRNFTTNPSMQNGAYVLLGYSQIQHSDLLDMTTPGNSIEDAALALGATFTDADTGITIKPTARGGSSPNEYMDLQITLPEPISLATALDAPGVTWTTGGDAAWKTETSESFDHVDAVISGSISDRQTTWLKASISGPGSVSFRWKVSSEADYDFFRFKIDGVEKSAISGAQDWQFKSYTLPTGSHNLEWSYSKDGAAADGKDAGWLDSVTVGSSPAASYTAPLFFNGEMALGNGVYYLQFASGNFFGYYSYLADPNYIYHFDLGYEYVFDAADGKSGVYLYDFASGHFFYSSPAFPFPYLYDFSLGTVLYYYSDPNNAGHYNTNGVRFFYNFGTGKIFSQ